MTSRRLLAAAVAAAVPATLVIGSFTSASSVQTTFTVGRVSAAAGTSLTGPIAVVGTGGLSWSDVSSRTTPALWSLLRDGASGTVTVHSVHANTCPVDGWLTLSAGEQAGDVDNAGGAAVLTGRTESKPPCQALPAHMAAGTVPHWGEYRTAAAATRFNAALGLLGDQVADHGGCIQAVGPGAALGAATSKGIVDLYQKYDDSTLPAALARCPATLIDAGLVRDPGDVDPADEIRPTTTRAQQVAAIDARIAEVLKAAPAGTDVIVASLADAGVTQRLRLIAATGPHFGTGTLESSSTRTPGLVQLTDLTPTILEHLGIPAPQSLGGTPLRFVPANTNSELSAVARRRALLDDDEASHIVQSLVAPFFSGWVLLQVMAYLIAAALWRSGRGTGTARRRLLRVTRQVAIVAATVPVSTFLANLLPWWRFPVPLVSVVASVAVFAAAISMVALLTPWRRRLLGPLVAVCAATMAVLALDVITGSRLQLSSLLGLQPVVGGRFYGMGNVTFALFATATLLLCTAVGSHLVTVGHRYAAAASVTAIGLTAVVVDGSPSWGSDLGGPTALLPAVILLALTILQVRLTWRRLLAIGGGIGAFAILLGLLDWLRPAQSRSHLGRFAATTVDGGAWDIIARKLDQNITLLFGTPLTPLVPVALVLFAYLLARPNSRAAAPLRRSFARVPLLRTGLGAILLMWVVGFALNDSGAAIPAVGGMLALPLLIAVAVRAFEDEQTAAHVEQPAARASRLRR